MGFRFLHLADVHLETSFGGAERTRARLRAATLEAFERACDYALESRLHAVLVAGDLFDDGVLSLRTELELVRQVRRLAEGGVWFLLACGNHDPGGPIYRAAQLGLEHGRGAEPGGDGDAWLARVQVFRDPTPRRVTVTDPEGNPVAVVVGCGHPSPTCGDNLAARFEPVRSPLPTVGLLHTHLEGARAAEQHDRYAPSTAADFHRAGYGYWALGHVHSRQRAVPDLPVFYPGNLQGRNARETGEKGGLAVELGAQAAAEPEFVRFAPVRFARSRVDDLPAEVSATALVERLARAVEALHSGASEELVVRLELGGATPLARTLRTAEECSALAEELALRTGVLEVELRADRVRAPGDARELARGPTILGQALALAERAARDDALLRELAPQPLARRHEPGSVEERAYLQELLAELPEEAALRFVAAGAADR